MGTAQFHYELGALVREREVAESIEEPSILGAAYEAGVPIYTSSPGDSSIGMTVALHRFTGNALSLDSERDVNELAALVYHAKRAIGQSALLVLGGGSPKNFALQSAPYLQEITEMKDAGFDYYAQITDARVDTGGLSGATPSEAMTWGKIQPDRLEKSVVCYSDTSIALPILGAYVLANTPPRPPRRLYDRREELLQALERDLVPPFAPGR
jgi:deoxyhypusine synthase